MPESNSIPSTPTGRGAGDRGPVLVFGATGQQGGAVARVLLAGGRQVRVLTRDPNSVAATALARSGAEVFSGQFSDAASLRHAMTGAGGVFSVQPSSGQGEVYGMTDENEILYASAIADLAVELGVGHLVYSSALPAGKGPTGLGHFEAKTTAEAHLRSLDLPSTVVRPATFMELLLQPGMGLERDALTFFLKPDQMGQLIAVEDIGRIVAGVFAHPERYAGQSLDIAGDSLTGREIGAALTAAAGRPVAYHRIPDEVLARNDFLARIADLFDDGRLAGAADVAALRRAFGPLQTFEAWLTGTGRPLLAVALDAGRARPSPDGAGATD